MTEKNARVRETHEIGETLGLRDVGSLDDSEATPSLPERSSGHWRRVWFSYLRTHLPAIGIVAFVLLIVVGIMARNGWLPSTDPASGKRTGWFGSTSEPGAVRRGSRTAVATGFRQPLPSATPQLAREYVYAGSRLLSVVDANANETPPSDLAVWRPGTNGAFYVMGPGGSIANSASWGTTNDQPVQGDFDGDGKTDFCVFRSTTNYWYFIYSSNNATAGFAFGSASDIPAVADFDGDGKTDVAVFRPSNGTWYIAQSSTGNTVYQQFGQSGDVPAPADHDGDGKADISLWRPASSGTFYTLRSSNGQLQTTSYGASGDLPIPSDYDGDGKADFAVFRPGSSAYFYIYQSSNSTTATYQFGTTVDKPVPNDYDGDGKTDIAVWRSADSYSGAGDNGNWYILKSGSGNAFRADHWGQTYDIPVPAYYKH